MTTRQRWALAVAALGGPLPDVARDPRVNDTRDRPTVMRAIGDDIQTRRAYPLANAIRAAANAARTGLVSEADAWHVILFAAGVAQQSYSSWQQLGEAYEEELDGISDGRAYIIGATRRALADSEHAWNTLPWATDLGETYLSST